MHVLIITNGCHLFIMHTMDQYSQGLSQSGSRMIPSVIALPYGGESEECFAYIYVRYLDKERLLCC